MPYCPGCGDWYEKLKQHAVSCQQYHMILRRQCPSCGEHHHRLDRHIVYCTEYRSVLNRMRGVTIK